MSSERMPPRVPPPVITLLAGTLMWQLGRRVPLARLIEPPWNRLAALPAAAGVAIVLAAIARFRRAHTTVNPLEPHAASSLVTEGVFRISRNPMYLGLLLLLIGWGLWLGTASPFIVPPLFVLFLSLAQIAPEERALEAIFGARYRAYRREVPRWVGRRRTPGP